MGSNNKKNTIIDKHGKKKIGGGGVYLEADHLGERIKMVRLFYDMKQEKFSGSLGISKIWITNIEAGTSQPSLELLVQIAVRFGVNINWLLRGEGSMLDPLDVVAQPPQSVQPLQALQQEGEDLNIDAERYAVGSSGTNAGELRNLLISAGYTVDEVAAAIGIPADILKRFIEKDVPVPFYLVHRIRAVLNGIDAEALRRGRIVKGIRKELGLTQIEFCSQSGLPMNSLEFIELGKKMLTEQEAERIENAFGLEEKIDFDGREHSQGCQGKRKGQGKARDFRGKIRLKDDAQIRYEAIRAVEIGEMSVTESCKHFGFSRETYYKYKRLYESDGIAGLITEHRGPWGHRNKASGDEHSED